MPEIKIKDKRLRIKVFDYEFLTLIFLLYSLILISPGEGCSLRNHPVVDFRAEPGCGDGTNWLGPNAGWPISTPGMIEYSLSFHARQKSSFK